MRTHSADDLCSSRVIINTVVIFFFFFNPSEIVFLLLPLVTVLKLRGCRSQSTVLYSGMKQQDRNVHRL